MRQDNHSQMRQLRLSELATDCIYTQVHVYISVMHTCIHYSETQNFVLSMHVFIEATNNLQGPMILFSK